MRKIWFGAGCFWGAEAYFSQLKGVLATKVGYGQGKTDHPSYREVCSGVTGHAEICEVTYDEAVISLSGLLGHYFRIIDPTSMNRQGADIGTQYRTGIYCSSEAEQAAIREFIDAMQPNYAKPIVVEVEICRNFFPAEEYHQQY